MAYRYVAVDSKVIHSKYSLFLQYIAKFAKTFANTTFLTNQGQQGCMENVLTSE